MADDRLELKCDHCGETQPIAVLHTVNYRAFMDTERLQAFIEKHIGCLPEPPCLTFPSKVFSVVIEHGPEAPKEKLPPKLPRERYRE